MPRPSSIDTLPDEIRDEVNRRLQSGRETQLEIVEDLTARGFSVSRSAMSRHAIDHREVTESVNAGRELARAVGRELTEESTTDLGRLMLEDFEAHLYGMYLRLRTARTDEELLPLYDLMTRQIERMSRARKDRITSSLSVARYKEEHLREVADEAAQVVAQKGLSHELVEDVRSTILGLLPRAK